MYTMGIDIGSSSSKVVILQDGIKVSAWAVIQAGTGSSGPARAQEEALLELGLTTKDMAYVVATGYGRNTCELADTQISEISCHARGVSHLLPMARTVIDIGGQDVKAILINDRGLVQQFYMNDKCAAGTGRFLEVMSRVLEVPLEKMCDWGERATSVAPVSSTCTVFAESEVISQLSIGVPKENIIAGVHRSVASKACSLVVRIGSRENIIMSGGVARNRGVVAAISQELGKQVQVAPNPQIIGALGAALFAHKEYERLKG